MNVLIIDNRSHNQSTLNARLTKIVEYNLSNLMIDIAPKPSDAIQKVKNKSYNIIFLDLKLTDEKLEPNEEPLYDGIQLCEEIKQINSSSIVIIYSADILYGKEDDFDYKSDCISAGADVIISKKKLFDLSAHQLHDFMTKQLKIKDGSRLNNRPITDDEDIKTKALYESISKSTISEIIHKLIPGMIDDKVSVIEPGYSGAFILLVKSSSNERNQFNIENVIKISSSNISLATELKRAPLPGSYLHSLSVTPSSREQVKIDDFYCINIPKVRNAKLLSEVLNSKRATSEMKSTFLLMLNNLIIEPINQAFSWEYSKGVVSDNFSLTYSTGYEIIKNLDVIITSNSVLKKQEINQAKFIYEYILKYYEDYYKFTNDIHKLAYLQGDLHCKNIFYLPNQNPIIIDFGRSTVYPRLFDAAALNVDLIISQLDAQKGKSLDLKNIDSWTKIYMNLYPFNNNVEIINHDPVVCLLNMLNKSIVENINEISRIEYSEVLVFHLLRYIRFPNITFPKKVLIVKYLHSLINDFLVRK